MAAMQIGNKHSERLGSDLVFLGSVCLLLVVGTVVLYSAGFDPERETSQAFWKQLGSIAIGLFAFVGCSLISSDIWRKLSIPCFIVTILLLIGVLLVGVSAGGAQRWLKLGFVRIQPSEFSKVGLVLALAWLFSSRWAPRAGYSMIGLVAPMCLMALPTLLVAIEPDLGTGLCHLMIGGSMLLLAGIRFYTLATLTGSGLLMLVPLWSMLKDYQKQRILTFMSPELDPLGSGYHAIQSKIAVGSGNLLGKGFMAGTQSQLSFLPEQTTDFLFSVLAEEWGFIGVFVVIFAYGLLLARLLHFCSRSKERFPAFVCFGAAAMVFWHVVVNIGMVTGVLPVVGLTLPLLSFGGSSLISVLGLLGVAYGARRQRLFFTDSAASSITDKGGLKQFGSSTLRKVV